MRKTCLALVALVTVAAAMGAPANPKGYRPAHHIGADQVLPVPTHAVGVILQAQDARGFPLSVPQERFTDKGQTWHSYSVTKITVTDDATGKTVATAYGFLGTTPSAAVPGNGTYKVSLEQPPGWELGLSTPIDAKVRISDGTKNAAVLFTLKKTKEAPKDTRKLPNGMLWVSVLAFDAKGKQVLPPDLPRFKVETDLADTFRGIDPSVKETNDQGEVTFARRPLQARVRVQLPEGWKELDAPPIRAWQSHWKGLGVLQIIVQKK